MPKDENVCYDLEFTKSKKQTHKIHISGSTCAYCRSLWPRKSQGEQCFYLVFKRNKAKASLCLAHSIMSQQQQQLLDLRQPALIAAEEEGVSARKIAARRARISILSCASEMN